MVTLIHPREITLHLGVQFNGNINECIHHFSPPTIWLMIVFIFKYVYAQYNLHTNMLMCTIVYEYIIQALPVAKYYKHLLQLRKTSMDCLLCIKVQ